MFVKESASRLEKLKELQDMVNVNIEMGKLLDRRVGTLTQDQKKLFVKVEKVDRLAEALSQQKSHLTQMQFR